MLKDLPPAERPHQKGEAPQEAQVRSDQAHGTLPREARGRNQGKEGRGPQEQAHWVIFHGFLSIASPSLELISLTNNLLSAFMNLSCHE